MWYSFTFIGKIISTETDAKITNWFHFKGCLKSSTFSSFHLTVTSCFFQSYTNSFSTPSINIHKLFTFVVQEPLYHFQKMKHMTILTFVPVTHPGAVCYLLNRQLLITPYIPLSVHHHMWYQKKALFTSDMKWISGNESTKITIFKLRSALQ